MRVIPVLAALACLMPAMSPAAECRGRILLQCDTSATRSLQVCLQGETFHYSYGPRGRPEISLTASAASGPVTPWPGVGSAIWSGLTFQNAAHSYQVWTSFERGGGDYEAAGVTVLKGDSTIATVNCLPDKTQKPLPLFEDVMTGLGYCHTPAQPKPGWTRC